MIDKVVNERLEDEKVRNAALVDIAQQLQKLNQNIESGIGIKR